MSASTLGQTDCKCVYEKASQYFKKHNVTSNLSNITEHAQIKPLFLERFRLQGLYPKGFFLSHSLEISLEAIYLVLM